MYPEASSELIKRARSDRTAFGELYDLYLQRVYAFCLARTKDRDEAEDVVAQTFERALNAIGRYEDRGAPCSGWLLRIAANVMIDHARRHGRVIRLDDDESLGSQLDRADESDPSVSIERWERVAWLRAQLVTLPADQQQAIRLRYWRGLSVAEVARHMGRNENATKQLLHRAVANLRARLGGVDD
jgi:RNA polymerase sigma-70 factor (ECF subfamily)